MKIDLKRVLQAARAGREIIRAVRQRPTPGWALPICPSCRISMRAKGSDTFVCPECQLRLWKGAPVERGPIMNEGDHRGPL